MSDVGATPELGRLSLLATDKHGSFQLELVLRETAYDEELRAWRTSASIYGYQDRTFTVAGYGASTMQALSMVLEQICRKLIGLVDCGIDIEIHDLHNEQAIEMLSTAGSANYLRVVGADGIGCSASGHSGESKFR